MTASKTLLAIAARSILAVSVFTIAATLIVAAFSITGIAVQQLVFDIRPELFRSPVARFSVASLALLGTYAIVGGAAKALEHHAKTWE